MTEKPRALVIGGTGFIGSHLVRKLVKADFSVVSLSIHSDKGDDSSVKYISCDISDHKLLKQKISFSFDYVFNLGGYINHSGFDTNEGIKTFDTHFESIKYIVSLLDRKRIKRFIQFGSSDEYGDAVSPQNEISNGEVFTPYAKGKLFMTEFLINKFKLDNFPVTIIRLFLVYGPGQDESRLIPYVINNCLRNADVELSSGDQLRDFLYIDDLIEAIEKIIKTEKLKGEIINIASGNQTKIKSVVKMIHKIISKGNLNFGSRDINRKENSSLVADVTKAQNILEWKSKVKLEEGIKKTIAYYD